MKKILGLNDLNSVFETNKAEIVLCYGHFNTLHPGHFRYFDYARKFGKKLYILLQSDQEIDKDLRSHYFSQKQRATALLEIAKIDGVILYEDKLLEAIKLINANSLVLGKEHENSKDSKIKETVKEFRNIGGNVIFHAGDIVYADASLNFQKEKNIEGERKKTFSTVLQRNGINKSGLLKIINKFHEANLLIIGDTIVDEYIACDALGMSAEAPLVVFRELDSKNYIGGAAIVASHVNSLGANCKYISIVGNDEKGKLAKSFLTKSQIKNKIFIDKTRPTTFKIRYMVNNQKIFRASKLKDHSVPKVLEEQLIKEISDNIADYNGILISDFVYGMITPKIIKVISQLANRYKIPVFGDVQSSSQYGNILKFNNFELLCPNEREARIALGNNDDSIESVAQQILKKTKSNKLILKLGSNGFVSYDINTDGFIDREHFPALTVNAADETGAGDSLLSAISVCLAIGTSLAEASAIATYMASLSVQTIGNNPITKERLIEEIFK